MNFKEKFSSFDKKSKVSKELEENISKLPANEIIASEILKTLENNHTKIVLDEEFKNSYYVYLNDTIYLSNRDKVKNDSSRVVLIAHEARHSIQSKVLQIINFAISNIELVAFVINMILFLFKKFSIINIYVYLGIIIFSIIPRLILEFDAVINSIKITKNYLKEKFNDKVVDRIICLYKFKIKCLMLFFILNLIFGKTIRLIILILSYNLLLT